MKQRLGNKGEKGTVTTSTTTTNDDKRRKINDEVEVVGIVVEIVGRRRHAVDIE